MSFMFKPYPHVDSRAVNRPELPRTVTGQLTVGNAAIAAKLLEGFSGVLALDGYCGADFGELIARLRECGKITVIEVSNAYKDSETLEEMLAESLPADREMDPILIFGKSVHREIESLFDPARVAALNAQLARVEGVTVLVGQGAACSFFRDRIDRTAFLDLTPLSVTCRIQARRVRCLGDTKERSSAYIFRRCYYYDYEVMMLHRRNLIARGEIDFYIDGNLEYQLKMLPLGALWEIFDVQLNYPFRCTPVYLEGVWGGFFVKKLRQLPDDMRNVAWVFDMIPNEVSLQIKVGKYTLNIPFSTFFKAVPEKLMG